MPHSEGGAPGLRARVPSCSSARAAAASACSSYTRTQALTEVGSPSWLCVPSRSRMRSRHAPTSSEAESSPSAISAEASTTPRSAGCTMRLGESPLEGGG